jgi:hypothetical protein
MPAELVSQNPQMVTEVLLTQEVIWSPSVLCLQDPPHPQPAWRRSRKICGRLTPGRPVLRR